jgi:molybdopterin-binding protein
VKFSGRNQLKEVVKSIKHGPVSTEVVIRVDKDMDITSVITETAAKEL